MSMDFIEAMNELKEKKGSVRMCCLKRSRLLLISSYKRNFNTAQNVRVDMNRNTGVIRVYARKMIVEEVLDPRTGNFIACCTRNQPTLSTGRYCGD